MLAPPTVLWANPGYDQWWPCRDVKHCQRHNGPEGWVQLTKLTWWVIQHVQTQILIKFHLQNLDQALTSKSQQNISISTKSKVKILSKPSFKILTKIQLRNLNQTSAAKYWPNFSFKISPKLQLQNLDQVLKVWTKVKLYDQISASKSATNCRQHDPHH